MTRSHTPGPWTFDVYAHSAEEVEHLRARGLTPIQNCGNDGERYVMCGARGSEDRFRVAVVDSRLDRVRRGKHATPYDAPDAERDANARLIAAAPDLYAALRAILTGKGDTGHIEFNDAVLLGRHVLAQIEEAADAPR